MQWLKAYFDRINPDVSEYDPCVRRNEKAKDHNKSMSFVGVKGDKKDDVLKALPDNGVDISKEKLKKKDKGETQTQLKEKDNKLDQSRRDIKGGSNKDDEKLNKELEKSKNVISDLKDQLV